MISPLVTLNFDGSASSMIRNVAAAFDFCKANAVEHPAAPPPAMITTVQISTTEAQTRWKILHAVKDKRGHWRSGHFRRHNKVSHAKDCIKRRSSEFSLKLESQLGSREHVPRKRVSASSSAAHLHTDLASLPAIYPYLHVRDDAFMSID